MRPGKLERAIARANRTRALRKVPEGRCRSAWDNPMPAGKPSRDWGYDNRTATAVHKKGLIRHI